jgi:tRNA(fMet)-specific endonuclease VapC
MSIALLDSDAVVDFLRGFEPSVELLRSLADAGDTLGVCDVVLAEVYSGLRPDDRPRVGFIIAGLAYLETSAEAARLAGEWRYDFARRGVVLATSDVLVAATAVSHKARLVTGNLPHYPMPELALIPLPRPRRPLGG